MLKKTPTFAPRSLSLTLSCTFARVINTTMLQPKPANILPIIIEATVAEKLWQLFLTIQLTIAEILEIDCTKMMRVIFQLPEVKKTLKSLSEIFFEDHFSKEFNKAKKKIIPQVKGKKIVKTEHCV